MKPTCFKAVSPEAEGYFFRTTPRGELEGIHEDDPEWHRTGLSLDDIGLDLVEVPYESIPVRLQSAPTRP
jgi:hypothetical protein